MTAAAAVAGIGHNNPPEPMKRVPPIMPGAILCTIPQACAAIARGRQFIYDAMSAGMIRGVKSDGRTLIVVQSLHDYAASLPPAKLKRTNR
jgi:hypothetical protein